MIDSTVCSVSLTYACTHEECVGCLPSTTISLLCFGLHEGRAAGEETDRKQVNSSSLSRKPAHTNWKEQGGEEGRERRMAGGGADAALKQDDTQPHPVKDQLPDVSYCITSPPPWPEAFLLGFQHYLVMLGTTVIIPTALVPQMGGGNDEKARVIQTLLFVAGLNTLLQTTFGTRLPAVIGGSYTFVVPTISIILAARYSTIVDPHQRFLHIMRGTQGALIVSSAIQIILGFSGLWRIVVRLLSPLSAAPLVALAGFGLYEFGFPGYIPHLLRSKKHVFDRYAVLFSIAIVWLYAFILTVGGAYKHAAAKTRQHCRTDRSGLIASSPWIRVPYPFQWGAPTFNGGEAFAMMAAAFVALVESTGTFIAVSRYSSATPVPPSILGRGVGWQGIGILLDGLFGTANGSTVSVENAGLIALTRVGSRRVVQISAGFMIFFSILGKFGAVFASVPGPIIAALYCLFFAYVGVAGLGLLQFCNLNSFRTKFILGFSVFLGLSVPQYFNEYTSVAGYGPAHTGARWFNDMVNVAFSSEALVAGFVAYFLDNTLHRNDPTARKDRGYHFWDKFRSYRTDPRSEEFYSLPFNLNKFFPAD
ncbi:Permease family [Musa troglodytarum]|uniref:Permease family n=2 Tax=Magnoliopsida TaxID=3398 RepID=A0A9E7F4G2_9LILI|nr:Permease family [Musa troglodytarum]